MESIVTILEYDNSMYLDDDFDGWILEDYLNTEDPTYQEVIDFLLWDKTDKLRWVEGIWMCMDFATAVHNTAELNGFKCGFTKIWDLDREGGHVCLAWNTVDYGLIYTDSTGVLNPDFNELSYDCILKSEIGEELTGYYIDTHEPISYEFIVSGIETIW